MAQTILMENKSGQKFYKVIVSRGHGKTAYSTRWYVPKGIGEKEIQRRLQKFVSEYENDIKNGTVLLRSEQKEKAEYERMEQEKILTVEDFFDKVFIPEIKITCSDNTVSSFTGMFKKHISENIGQLKMNEVSSAMLSSLLLAMQSSGLKCSTCVKVYTILNLMFKKAYLCDSIEKNPMDKVKRPKPTKSEGKDTETKAFTENEIKYIISCISQEDLKWRTFISLLIETGIRKGECCGIKWNNIDFENGTITIENNIVYTPETGITCTTTKSGKKRIVYIDTSLIELLQQMHSVIDIRNRNGFVFVQDDGTSPMSPQTPTKYFKRLEKKYDIEDFHPHKLRHSFASIAIINGADIASVSEVLGHADKATTLRMYTHADEESKKRAAELVRNAIKA